MGIQFQKVQIEHLQLDTHSHVITHQLRDKQTRGEPITIENFLKDTITYKTGKHKECYKHEMLRNWPLENRGIKLSKKWRTN